MCGIFGGVSSSKLGASDIKKLAIAAQSRGQDSSGIVYDENNTLKIIRTNRPVSKLLRSVSFSNSKIVAGHSRLITNGLHDNQPIFREDITVLHNGIIVNTDDIWEKISIKRELEIDSEAIAGLALHLQEQHVRLSNIPKRILAECKGAASVVLIFHKLGKIILFSNTGSLYTGRKDGSDFFASEEFSLRQINCLNIKQVLQEPVILEFEPLTECMITDEQKRHNNLIPTFKIIESEEKHLLYEDKNLNRCSRCILPETMPFISFDENNVCNYCNNYRVRNHVKPRQQLEELIKNYRKMDGSPECIVPFSGGRDSTYALHLIVKELGLKPVTYTYDWGMVTDLGRRNISRMCSKFGVENIIVAADIRKKRQNIKNNLAAFLKDPHLGMMSILTAGDKHFFKHIETVKQKTGLKLNMWGVNPLEVTHFKSGFLGVSPDFLEEKVYTTAYRKQLSYQAKRLKVMLRNPSYFNSSLFDTLSGEYHRSIRKKTDYFHVFDYWKWDEQTVDNTIAQYEWELATDTNTTWRIGDGTAAFYNYVYFTLVGFTEHDTFRSNQIREGQLDRATALEMVLDENRPRYQNIRWYLDALNMDFLKTINTINSHKNLYVK